MKHVQSILILMLAAASCGGSQDKVGTTPVGESQGSSAADDLDVPDEGAQSAGGSKAGQGGDTGSTGQIKSAEPRPPVTFKLVNSADEDLVFSVDKGWQPVIFAFSGKPPNAKSILMFPTFCTASCDAAESDRCPYCPAPEKVKDIKAAEKREVVAASAALEVPWDGQIYVYEKTRGTQDGKSKKCDCYRRQAAPEGAYTVRACGLRITKSAKSSTKYQCVEAAMQLPAATPQVIELVFPKP